MLKLFIFLGIVATVSFNAKAQVTSTQRINASSVQLINLQLQQVAFVDIKTSDRQEIEIKTESSGEYSQDIGLKRQIKQDELLIESFFDTKLKDGFDKLSATKVFSIGLHLVIPADIKVNIRTDITHIKLYGDYDAVQIENKFGNSQLFDFHGNAKINSYSGNVHIRTSNAAIEAFTENGEKKIAKMTRKKHFIKVKTVDGNIQIESLF